jgi:hypothetical protein
LTLVDGEPLAPLIERIDRVHGSLLATGPDVSWLKEWFHFAILGPGMDAILNLNLSRDTRPAAPGGGEWLARTILLAHDGGWHGGIDSIPLRDVTFGPGLWVQFGHNTVRLEDGNFLLSAGLERQPISISLMARPLTRPEVLQSQRTLSEGWISWAVIPRLVARGTVAVGRRVHRLEGALVYHDHNWGNWLWGQDFSWDWGFGLPDDPSVPWSLVFDRTSDRARGRTSALTFAVWKGASVVRRFRAEEIQVRQHGHVSSVGVRKFPPVMAILASELTTDVPARFHVEAGSDRDHIALAFQVEDLAQIVVPNETDLGVTVINETVGRVRADGVIDGEAVRMEGRGHFEFLRN